MTLQLFPGISKAGPLVFLPTRALFKVTGIGIPGPGQRLLGPGGSKRVSRAG